MLKLRIDRRIIFQNVEPGMCKSERKERGALASSYAVLVRTVERIAGAPDKSHTEEQ